MISCFLRIEKQHENTDLGRFLLYISVF